MNPYPDPVETAPHPPAQRAPSPPAPHRRRLVTVLSVLVSVIAVFFAGVVGIGWWVRSQVDANLATQIRGQLPGARVTVSISSFPFLFRLAASGTVGVLSAHLQQVSAGPFTYDGVRVPAATFRDVYIRVDDLRVSRDALVHHRVVIEDVRRATIIATLDQATVDRSVGLPLTLGRGAVGLGGLTLPAGVNVQTRQITVTVPNQLSFSFSPPPLQVFPCNGDVRIVPGLLRISCTLDRLPPVLTGRSFSF